MPPRRHQNILSLDHLCHMYVSVSWLRDRQALCRNCARKRALSTLGVFLWRPSSSFRGRHLRPFGFGRLTYCRDVPRCENSFLIQSKIRCRHSGKFDPNCFFVAFEPQILKLNGRFHASFLRDMLDLTVSVFPEKNLGCSVCGCSFSCVGTLILNFRFILNVHMRSNAPCKK